MARNLKLSNSSASVAADAVVDTLDGGKVRVYTGTQPANPGVAASGTLLVELTLPTPAFGSASSGVATANTIPRGSVVATGTPGWFRVLQSNGTTAVFDGSVGTVAGDYDMVIGSSSLASGSELEVNSLTYTQPTS
jgi:hypothetical protein